MLLRFKKKNLKQRILSHVALKISIYLTCSFKFSPEHQNIRPRSIVATMLCRTSGVVSAITTCVECLSLNADIVTLTGKMIFKS